MIHQKWDRIQEEEETTIKEGEQGSLYLIYNSYPEIYLQKMIRLRRSNYDHYGFLCRIDILDQKNWLLENLEKNTFH